MEKQSKSLQNKGQKAKNALIFGVVFVAFLTISPALEANVTVNIKWPTEPHTANGALSMEATASATNNYSVTKVDFLLSSSTVEHFLCTGTYASNDETYACWSVDITTYPSGEYELTARAHATRQARPPLTADHTIAITVDNDPNLQVAITNPSANATARGWLSITGSASVEPNFEVDSVAVFLFPTGNGDIEPGTPIYTTSCGNSSECSFDDWADITAYDSGSYTFLVRALAHSTTKEATREIVIDNVDRSSPTATLIRIGNEYLDYVYAQPVIEGNVDMIIAAQDPWEDEIPPTGVQRVEVWIDDHYYGDAAKTGHTTPEGDEYAFSWDAGKEPNGANVVVRAVAVDGAGNRGTDEVEVGIRNPNDGRPQVVVLAPVPDAAITETVRFMIEARDEVGIGQIEVFINGEHELTDVTGVHDAYVHTTSFSWDPLAQPNGDYTLTAVATDRGGKTAIAHRRFLVANPDIEPPTVAIAQPKNGEEVSGSVTVIAHATDNVGVASVLFYVDGGAAANVDTPPFVFNWDTRLLDRRDYTLKAQAFDAAGNAAWSEAVTVKVVAPKRSSIHIEPSPADQAIVADPIGGITACFPGLENDPLAHVSPESALTVEVTKNGVRRPIAGEVSWWVASDKKCITFSGDIPENAAITWQVDIEDGHGARIQGFFRFYRTMPKETGGIVSTDVGDLILHIPSGRLPRDAYVAITPLEEEGDSAIDTGPVGAGQRIGRPFRISATDVGHNSITSLNAPAVFTFVLPNATETIESRNRVYQLMGRNASGEWSALQTGTLSGAGSGSAAAGATVSYMIDRLTDVQIIAFQDIQPGITDLFNFPNPFSAGSGGTEIHFFLDQDSAVQMTVFDLFGRVVRAWNIPPGAAGGRAGQNIVPWNGRNGAGEALGNGGYVLHLTSEGVNGGRSRARTKMLVVK